MPRNALKKPPKLLRSAIARGLEAGAVIEPGKAGSAGFIRGLAVITRGEALGHDMWIDGEFLSSVADAINESASGVKARFTHPSLSGDGLGKFLGRVQNASVDGDVVRGDLHFSSTAHETPDGDLAAYVTKLAQSDPAAFGESISFEHDWAAEEDFLLAHGATWDEDAWGRFLNLAEFQSPDEDNSNNFPHARLKTLRAVDTVDDPAANPGGLFHRGQTIVQEAEALLSYSLGLSDHRPELAALELDADRAGAFITRFLDRHGLAVTPSGKERTMPKGKLNTDTETKPADEKPAEGAASETKPDEEEKPAETKPAEGAATETKPTEASTGKGDGERFLAAFGEKGGVWFAQGKTFEEAGALHLQDLKAQNAALAKENGELRAKLTKGRGEAAPVSFQAEDSKPQKTEKEIRLNNNLGPSLSRFASAIKLPGRG